MDQTHFLKSQLHRISILVHQVKLVPELLASHTGASSTLITLPNQRPVDVSRKAVEDGPST